ncbi:MAG: xanthine dehydrogenase family protein [Acidobacteria bacterium]|nr:xanthine dehydrogenase family protein [Acidobacteriota bacterium]
MNRSVTRRDARAKTTGAALYAADLEMPGALWGVTVRSDCARGRIAGFEFDAGFPWRECTVAGPADIPGDNCVAHITDDQPCLAASEINHWSEPLLLIAHPDRYMAEAARRAVRVRQEPAEPLLDMELSTRVFQEYWREQGDAGHALREAAVVVEGVYRTPAVDQLYLEPQAMVATASPERGVFVRGSMQCPYYVRHALERLFHLPGEKVRVAACETGGGFGGKEDYPSMLACHAALLAWKSGRPVRMIYDRAEDLAATTKRHPSRTLIRSGFDPDGRLLALDIDFLIDGGAYTTLSPVVLSRGLIHSTGPYQCDNARLRGRAVASNHPPYGAFRGFGVPQSCFAIERHMDTAAARLGLRPDELRRRNLFRAGARTATGQLLVPDPKLAALLDRAVQASGYAEKFERYSVPCLGPVRRGIGLSCSFHGTGFTGAGEDRLRSEVVVELAPGGGLRVLVSSVDMGQGAATVLAQMAAEAFGCAAEDVEVPGADTAMVPDSGPTVASRTTSIVGALVERCARELREGPSGLRRATARYEPPPGVRWDEAAFSGDAYGGYSWAVQVAEVRLDTDTGEVRVERITAAVDAGRIVNPELARGQVEGGIVQGAGFALSEETIYRDGRIENAQLANTIIPTAPDAPSIEVIFADPEAPEGPRGLGELPLNGAAPAIVNAITQAAGGPLDSLPASPERILEMLRA